MLVKDCQHVRPIVNNNLEGWSSVATTTARKAAPAKAPAKAAPAKRTTTAKAPASPAPARRARKVKIKQPTAPQETITVPTGDDDELVGLGGGLVLAAVPDRAVADAYIHRTLPGGVHDFDMLDEAFDTGMSVLIEGPTGPGKTMFTRAWAATRKKVLARVPCNVGIEPSQMFGKYIPNDEGNGYVWVDGPVTHVIRHGGVILINEVNFMPDRVASVLFGMLDDNREIVLQDHKGEVIKAHRAPQEYRDGNGDIQVRNCWCDAPNSEDCKSKWVLIVADMNPDYSGTRPLNMAFRNRYGIQQAWDYDPQVEKRLIRSRTLLDFAKQVRERTMRGEFETPLSTNMLVEFERLATGRLGLQFAVANLLNHYQSMERDPLKVVLTGAMLGNIEKDLAQKKEPEPSTPTTPAPQQQVYAERNTKYDPQWGVYGIEWLYEDEAQQGAQQ